MKVPASDAVWHRLFEAAYKELLKEKFSSYCCPSQNLMEKKFVKTKDSKK